MPVDMTTRLAGTLLGVLVLFLLGFFDAKTAVAVALLLWALLDMTRLVVVPVALTSLIVAADWWLS